jgi:CO/xanthine dehydrogenase Mo-binding subunit
VSPSDSEQPAATTSQPQASGTDGETAQTRQQTWGPPATQLDDWLAIEPDGTIIARSGKVELGTGVRTALTQIVAEELDVPLAAVRLEMGDTARTPNEGMTAGSKTLQMGGAALRNAAAEARRALLEMAAERLEAAIDDLVVHDGTIAVRGHTRRSVTYGEVMGGRRFDRQITGTAPLKPAVEYQIVGSNVPRLDLPDKFLGQPAFIHNLRLPGMLHGRVVRPPSRGAKLEALDDSAIRNARVVRIGSFVGVAAEREEDAIRATRALKVSWQETTVLPPMDQLYDQLRQQPTDDRVVVERGEVERGLANAATHLHATYHQPFHAHASIGPSCAVAELRDGMLTVWCSSQGVYPLRSALADLLQMPVERIHLIHVEGAGCYGHNGADDVAADAALLARAVDQPVRVQWSREDEFAWEPKSPAMLLEVDGGLDMAGNIVAWRYQAWSSTHGSRPRRAGDFIAGELIAEAHAPPTGFYVGGDRNAVVDYSLPNLRVVLHWLAREPLRTSAMRSLGATGNTFANESFMDELASAAGADPVAFRLNHLVDPRARAVIEAAAQRANWGGPLPVGIGRGIAFARYENREAYVATVAEVGVDEESGAVTLRRMIVAHDCGLIVNPDGLRNQIEGNVIQSASRALKEEVHFDSHRITSLDWESYPILTFSEVPEIDIVLLSRPAEPAVGAGEPATITTAAAIANAIAAATGARLREVPFTPARMRAALQSR